MSEKSELRQAYEKMSASLYHTRGRLTTVTAERNKLRQALEWIWREMATGGPSDIDTQDTLEKLGLLVEVPADEQFKQDWDADTMYVLAWQAKADDA